MAYQDETAQRSPGPDDGLRGDSTGAQKTVGGQAGTEATLTAEQIAAQQQQLAEQNRLAEERLAAQTAARARLVEGIERPASITPAHLRPGERGDVPVYGYIEMFLATAFFPEQKDYIAARWGFPIHSPETKALAESRKIYPGFNTSSGKVVDIPEGDAPAQVAELLASVSEDLAQSEAGDLGADYAENKAGINGAGTPSVVAGTPSVVDVIPEIAPVAKV